VDVIIHKFCRGNPPWLPDIWAGATVRRFDKLIVLNIAEAHAHRPEQYRRRDSPMGWETQPLHSEYLTLHSTKKRLVGQTFLSDHDEQTRMSVLPLCCLFFLGNISKLIIFTVY
jgi:hypothetical protein